MALSIEYTSIENLNDDLTGVGLLRHDPEHDIGRDATIRSDDTPNPQNELLHRWGPGNESSGYITTPETNETVSSSGMRQKDSPTTDANRTSTVSDSGFPSIPLTSPSINREPVSSAGTAHSRSGAQPTEAAQPRPLSMPITEYRQSHGSNVSRNPSHKESEVFVREVPKDLGRSSIQSGQSKYLSKGSWFMEISSFAIGLAALLAMVGVLARFDGRRMPNWPTGITLNTLIAVLAAIANAAIAAPLQQGLSQLKWITFQREPRPLTDMEHFDEASRGVFGSAKLLVLGRGG